MNQIKKYSFIIGLIIFAIILSKTNLEGIFQNIKNINPLYLILAMLMTIPTLFNKALCWNYIKRKQGIKYNLKDSFLMYCSGIYIGLITPGRIGEITKAIHLKKDGHSMGKSLVSTVIDRLSDFAFLLLFLFVGSLFLITIFQKQVLILILGIILSIAIFLIALKFDLIKWVINKLFNKLVPKKYQKSWKLNFQDFINDLKSYKLKHYLVILFITTFSWIFYYLQMFILAKGVGIDIPILYLAIIVTIAGLITLIPISISGIGTRDATLLALFIPFAITTEQIIAFSVLILLMSLFAAFVGLICWLIKPIKL
ncbi:flippase-like domain-containing protein [Patescibacteria group bacterium]|nr:flippase-like domain-containing protein [Patescibacteria group bacterium]